MLGEEAKSFGYGGTGKAATECKFEDYGQQFTAGDVITAYLVSALSVHPMDLVIRVLNRVLNWSYLDVFFLITIGEIVATIC